MRARQGKGRWGGRPGPASEEQFQRRNSSTADIRRETSRALPKGLDLPIYFVNEQWAVTAYGIECLDDYYVIEAERLDERRLGSDRPNWIEHLAGKSWVDLFAFIEAFRLAIRQHSHRYETAVTDDQIAAACSAAMRERADEEWFARRLQRQGVRK